MWLRFEFEMKNEFESRYRRPATRDRYRLQMDPDCAESERRKIEWNFEIARVEVTDKEE